MQTCTQHQAQKNQNYETVFFFFKLRIPQQYWLLFRTEASIYRSLIKHGFLENSPLIAVPIRISISRGFPPFMSHVRLHQKAYAQASSSEGHPRHPGPGARVSPVAGSLLCRGLDGQIRGTLQLPGRELGCELGGLVW